jgi:hypothetical protein
MLIATSVCAELSATSCAILSAIFGRSLVTRPRVARRTFLTWVAGAGQTQEARAERFRSLGLFARFLHAEDPRHEILGRNPFAVRKTRPVPYIYTPDGPAS